MPRKKTLKSVSTGPDPATQNRTLVEAKNSKALPSTQTPNQKPKPNQPYQLKSRYRADPKKLELATKILTETPNIPVSHLAAKAGLTYEQAKQAKARTIPKEIHELKRVQTLIRKELPADVRVRAYKAVVAREIPGRDAFSVLKAVQRAEELLGIVTKKERQDAESAKPAAPVALFVLPSGSSVSTNPVQVLTVQKESPVLSTNNSNLHNEILSEPKEDD